MPTKKKAELPEEMTTLLEAQESQTEENITASPAECAPDDACDTSLSQTEVKKPRRRKKRSRNRPSLTQNLKCTECQGRRRRCGAKTQEKTHLHQTERVGTVH